MTELTDIDNCPFIKQLYISHPEQAIKLKSYVNGILPDTDPTMDNRAASLNRKRSHSELRMESAGQKRRRYSDAGVLQQALQTPHAAASSKQPAVLLESETSTNLVSEQRDQFAHQQSNDTSNQNATLIPEDITIPSGPSEPSSTKTAKLSDPELSVINGQRATDMEMAIPDKDTEYLQSEDRIDEPKTNTTLQDGNDNIDDINDIDDIDHESTDGDTDHDDNQRIIRQFFSKASTLGLIQAITNPKDFWEPKSWQSVELNRNFNTTLLTQSENIDKFRGQSALEIGIQSSLLHRREVVYKRRAYRENPSCDVNRWFWKSLNLSGQSNNQRTRRNRFSANLAAGQFIHNTPSILAFFEDGTFRAARRTYLNKRLEIIQRWLDTLPKLSFHAIALEVHKLELQFVLRPFSATTEQYRDVDIWLSRAPFFLNTDPVSAVVNAPSLSLSDDVRDLVQSIVNDILSRAADLRHTQLDGCQETSIHIAQSTLMSVTNDSFVLNTLVAPNTPIDSASASTNSLSPHQAIHSSYLSQPDQTNVINNPTVEIDPNSLPGTEGFDSPGLFAHLDFRDFRWGDIGLPEPTFDLDVNNFQWNDEMFNSFLDNEEASK